MGEQHDETTDDRRRARVASAIAIVGLVVFAIAVPLSEWALLSGGVRYALRVIAMGAVTFTCAIGVGWACLRLRRLSGD